ncbi:hypothetical protein Sjap_015477 [Stephania japonica]|uniref:Uncharacterized protein n=1 Tax=Stephania japonica TaxID=461633 RepID=A0AAP0NSW2_9MAGN
MVVIASIHLGTLGLVECLRSINAQFGLLCRCYFSSTLVCIQFTHLEENDLLQINIVLN